ncbi:hypothetical protein [Vibrio sp. ES.051]
MMDGKAPQARFKGAVGGRRSFEMHHLNKYNMAVLYTMLTT